MRLPIRRVNFERAPSRQIVVLVRSGHADRHPGRAARIARRPPARCPNSPEKEGCVLTAHSCKMTNSLYIPSLMISLKVDDTGTHRALTAANGDRAEHIAPPEPALLPPAGTAAVASGRRERSRAN